jgi:hypothetical protein
MDEIYLFKRRMLEVQRKEGVEIRGLFRHSGVGGYQHRGVIRRRKKFNKLFLSSSHS